MADTCADNVVTLTREKSSCKVHLYGATVISWMCNSQEMLFVSAKSHFDNKKAIRGGIPLVFPHFGPWDKGPQHGFARINKWTIEKEPSKNETGNCTTAVFALEDNEDTRKLWDFKFKLLYTVSLGDAFLKTIFTVENTGSEAMSFTCLLHTYCKVPDVTKITIAGLKGVTFIDKVDPSNTKEETEERDLVTVKQHTDSVYTSTPNEHTVTGVGSGTLTFTKCCLPDTVVWNPWKERAAAMSDFGDEEYINMICVEAGYVAQPKVLQAGQKYEANQVLTAQLSRL